jgi:hypothetical protein
VAVFARTAVRREVPLRPASIAAAFAGSGSGLRFSITQSDVGQDLAEPGEGLRKPILDSRARHEFGLQSGATKAVCLSDAYGKMGCFKRKPSSRRFPSEPHTLPSPAPYGSDGVFATSTSSALSVPGEVRIEPSERVHRFRATRKDAGAYHAMTLLSLTTSASQSSFASASLPLAQRRLRAASTPSLAEASRSLAVLSKEAWATSSSAAASSGDFRLAGRVSFSTL